MLERAARELGLSMEGSFMVGDKRIDVACGYNAGLTSLLVTSGMPLDAARFRGRGARFRPCPTWPQPPNGFWARLAGRVVPK